MSFMFVKSLEIIQLLLICYILLNVNFLNETPGSHYVCKFLYLSCDSSFCLPVEREWARKIPVEETRFAKKN